MAGEPGNGPGLVFFSAVLRTLDRSVNPANEVAGGSMIARKSLIPRADRVAHPLHKGPSMMKRSQSIALLLALGTVTGCAATTVDDGYDDFDRYVDDHDDRRSSERSAAGRAGELAPDADHLERPGGLPAGRRRDSHGCRLGPG